LGGGAALQPIKGLFLNKKKNYRVRVAVPLAELILYPTDTSVRFDLGNTDERTPAVPRFVKIMVFAGSEAIFSS
jgi:hypothetical protein